MLKKLLLIGGMIMASSCVKNVDNDNSVKKFTNTEINQTTSKSDYYDMIKAYWNDKRDQATPNFNIPVIPLIDELLAPDESDILFRLGHSSILLRIDQNLILFDPVFSERASPVQWMGPKRFHQPPISIEQLPNIKAVIISHDHYDHLDKHAILELDKKVEFFITPLKVGKHLESWGIEKSKITELNWWQSTQVDTLKITATPAQHFSGRGLLDKDETLWASWAIQGAESNIYFGGDSGYFGGFKEIGERLGPFDLTLIETGAYHELWPEVHMFPEQSLQAHVDLKGDVMLPIHNGTFDLSLHNWNEPLQRITELAADKEVVVLTPKFGERVNVKTPERTTFNWWLKPQS
ncbi:MBL fold metallo-hydrolase [Paraglaciecola sp.]|uniref:MBL fold metallo-hydrolase n=1 Tax=Paraglaciecola sp. TaxID=1920173 RepID=UPI003299BEF7